MKQRCMLLTLAVLALPCACSRSKSEAANTTPSQAPQAPAARIANPCTLLTQADASAAASLALSPGVTRRFGIVTRCSFTYHADPSREVLLDVQNETTPVSDAELFDSYTHLPGVQRVSGIGDQALWVHNEIDSEVDILKGGRLVQMKLPRSIATMTPAVEKAAKEIAGRM